MQHSERITGLRPATPTLGRSMKSTVEPLEGNKVKVSVEVDEAEFDKEVDAAFKRIAREVRIPGFRPGKAPRQAPRGPPRHRGGPGATPSSTPCPSTTREAVDRARGRRHRAARDRHHRRARTRATSSFDAVVEVRPAVTVGGYDSLRVTIESPEVTDEEIDDRIDRLREQFAELADGRPPAPPTATSVTIDIAGSQDGEPQPGLTADDYLYEVGSGTVVPELDEQLAGAEGRRRPRVRRRPPRSRRGPGRLPGPRQGGQRRRSSPTSTTSGPTRPRSSTPSTSCGPTSPSGSAMMKKVQAQMALQEKTGRGPRRAGRGRGARAAGRHRDADTASQDLAMRLQAQGIDARAVPRAPPGRTRRRSSTSCGTPPTQAVKVDLALRAVAEAEGIEVDRRRPRGRVRGRRRAGRPEARAGAQAVRAQRADPVGTLRPRKRKALDWLLEHVEIVDERGQPVDREPRARPAEDDDRRRRCVPDRRPARRRRRMTDLIRSRGSVTRSSPRTTTWSPRSSSRPTVASGPSTSTPGCSRSTSSSWARRSTTRSPTWSAPSCCTSSRRTPTRTSTSTSTAPAATSRRCSRSTTRCSTSSPTSPRSASARPPRPPRCCSPAARQGKRLALPARPGPAAPAVGPGRRPGHRHRDPGQGDPAHARPARRDPRRPHRARPSRRSAKDTDRDFVLSAERGQGVRHHRRGDLRSGARRQPRPDHGRQLTGSPTRGT